VVSGEGSGSAKKELDGKQYDYVFDIDIEEGKPPLKLPYNLTESPWDAARKFLEANKLPMTYYEQVSNWISDNTKGASIGQSSAPTQQTQASDPWGMERRYRPGDVSSGAGGRKLPQRSFVSIVEGNPSRSSSRRRNHLVTLHLMRSLRYRSSLNSSKTKTTRTLRPNRLKLC
jgi:phospholipase A-2-activating protein